MNSQLRFCMVTTFYPPYHFGGDGMFVYRLSNELAARGHHVEVIHSIDAYNSLASSQQRGQYPNHPNVVIHALKNKGGMLSPLLSQQFGTPSFNKNEIKRIMADGNFDVIHFHNISLIGGPSILSYKSDAIKLYTMHEYWLVCPTHVLFKNKREACVTRNCLKCSLLYKRPPQLWRYTSMMGNSLKHIDTFIAPSNFAAQMHGQSGLNIPTVRIPMFVPKPDNSHDSDESRQQQLPLNSGRPYFLFVGRLEKLKGLQDVIQLFKEYQHADLLIAGNGTYQKKLQELADGSPQIKFLGTQSYEELHNLYRGAVAVIVPSLCYETFGQIIVEAFAHKTPVIVNDIGALRELVRESDGGLLYRNNSEMLKAMELFRTNEVMRSEFGKKGYAAYLKYWTEESHFEQYFKLIADLKEARQKKMIKTNSLDLAMRCYIE